jgi:type II secretory pathway pseudopilin PulG
MDANTIAGVVSAVIAVAGAVIAVWKWTAGRAQKRKAEKAAAELREQQRIRRKATRRPTVRRRGESWVFKGTGISPRGWFDRWR